MNASAMELQAEAVERSVAYDPLKRVIDFLGAAVLLTCLAPILLFCAIAIRLDSAGPIIFRQDRVGERGRVFTLLKFRSMRADADPAVHQAYAAEFIRGQGEAKATANGAIYKMVDDPRITRVGGWIRRASIDELPQLWNVVRGDMSLVGPRPPIPYEVQQYKPAHLRRLAVKPGITGLWQVSGRNQTTFERMVDLDVEYIGRRSLALDLSILLRTIPVVLFARDGG
jgi:lipopolysaccharide/colanic/teichoic acid biosynthesis glycosyltransferase